MGNGPTSNATAEKFMQKEPLGWECREVRVSTVARPDDGKGENIVDLV
jgi:hypothetical protein